MEYFTSVLAAFCLATLFLSQYSLLVDSKGWGAVLVSFCGLIYLDFRLEQSVTVCVR